MEISVNTRKLILSLAVIVIVSSATFVFNHTQKFYKSFVQGTRYFERKQYAKALPYFSSAYQIDPENQKAASYLIWTYENLGMRYKINEMLSKLLSYPAKDLKLEEVIADIYYNLKNYPQAEDYYRKILSQQTSFDVQRKLAEILVWQKKYPEALPLLEKLAKQHSADPWINELLADAYAWAKDFDKASKIYKKLLAQYCTKDLMLKLADALRYSGQNEEAIKLYSRYLETK